MKLNCSALVLEWLQCLAARKHPPTTTTTNVLKHTLIEHFGSHFDSFSYYCITILSTTTGAAFNKFDRVIVKQGQETM